MLVSGRRLNFGVACFRIAVIERITQSLPQSKIDQAMSSNNLNVRKAGLGVAGLLAGSVLCLPLFAPLAANAVDLGHGVSLKTKLTFAAETQRNFDLNLGMGDSFSFVEPKAKFELEAELSKQLKIVLEAEATLREIVEDNGDDEEDKETLKIEKAYVEFEPEKTDLTFSLGRQDIGDKMEWVLDEALDSVRVTYGADPIGFEFFAGRKGLVNLATPAEEDEDELIDTYGAFLRYKIDEKSYVDAFAIIRDGERFLNDDNEAEEENRNLIGVQSIGELNSHTKYWLNAAYSFGDTLEDDERTNLSGFGADVGATYVFDAKWEPSLTLGFAYGSEEFRQSGLQGNSHKFNGVTGFSYLGLLLEPELGNMTIFTAGLGVKPSEKSSIDLVYHYYSQVEAAGGIVDSNLDEDPDGTHKELGHGIDLVFGYKEIENLAIEAGFGVFFPGNAFESGADNAYYGKLEVAYSF